MRARILTSLAAGAAAVVALGLAMPTPATASPDLAAVSPYLSKQLTSLSGKTIVLVHGATLADATKAVSATGLTKVGHLREDRRRRAPAAPRPRSSRCAASPASPTSRPATSRSRFFAETSNKATRGLEARSTLTGADGTALTGKGVSVGVIDSGVDPTHPYFTEADGSSAVVAQPQDAVRPDRDRPAASVEVPNIVDTDTLSVGGHGTHVNGIVAGRDDHAGRRHDAAGRCSRRQARRRSRPAPACSSSAPTRRSTGCSRTTTPPVAPASPASTCPPIKVTNNSYGPTGGGAFDPNSATAKIQRALAAEGVVTVWANGNDGGDGSDDLSNPPGKDPTGGIISVASYYDQDTGTRDGTVSDFSSRGKAGDQSTYPDISAPGENITSSCRVYLPICSTGLDPQNGPAATDIGTFNTISGTSMAAPHIAGIVAQLFQANPSATPAQVEDALKTTAYKYTNGAAYEAGALGTTSFDKGYGLVDVVAAAAAVR